MSVIPVTPTHAGALLTWPAGSGPCAGTLQACIDSVAGPAIIEIVTGADIDEDIVLPASERWLIPAEGIQPQFAPGRGITGTFSGADNASVILRGLRFVDAGIELACAGTGGAHFQLDELRLDAELALEQSSLTVRAVDGCVVDASVHETRVVGMASETNQALLQLVADGGTLNGDVAYNQLSKAHTVHGPAAGILVEVSDGGHGDIRLFANQVSGPFRRSGIRLHEGAQPGATGSLDVIVYGNVLTCPHDQGDGLDLVVNNGTINAQVFNNTVSGCRRGIGALGSVDGDPAARISGLIWNNLLAVSNQAIVINNLVAST